MPHTQPQDTDEREKLRHQIDDLLAGEHKCGIDGWGCEIEEYHSEGRKNFRCKLHRETTDKLIDYTLQDRERAVLEARIDENKLFLDRFEQNNDPWRNHGDMVKERLSELDKESKNGKS